jgi:proline iminopeptidase
MTLRVLLCFYLFSALLGLPSLALGQLKIPTLTTYESGRFLCENKYKDIIAYEKGFYTEVPLDYSEPNSETTSVYAYFSGGFDPNRPTLLYFTGGPGQTAHWPPFQSKLNFNVLVMEQRGIGCSKPMNFQQYLSPDYYSSVAVARDALQIIQKLQISRVSAYGVSYGTVPATIFASLFPDSTEALVLEGTVFSGDASLWSAPHRRKILQRMLDTLPAEIKEKLNQITQTKDIPPTWFSVMARNRLMFNDGVKDFRDTLMDLMDEEKFKHFLQMTKDFFEPMTVEPHPLFVQNDIPYFMISCQEFSLGKSTVSTAEALESGSQLVPILDRESQSKCKKLGLKSNRVFSAENYPVQVPVTYFQGNHDSATTAPGAIRHFKTVPQKFSQILILKRGGHNPNKQMLEAEWGQMEIFELALKGQEIPQDLVSQFNEKSDLDWAVAYRHSGPTLSK